MFDTVGVLKSAGIDLPPTIASAIEKSQGIFMVLFITYLVLIVVLRAVLGRSRPRRSSDIAKSGSVGSPLSDVLAYNVIALAYAMGCGYIGVVAWFDGSAAAIGSTVQV